jgi:putative tricarboxylic transport membrane protein
MKFQRMICALGITALTGFSGFAHAQWKPTKTVDVIVHTGPGGGNDLLARAIAQMLEKEKLLPVRMQVINKTGGNGAVAAAAIAEKRRSAYAGLYFHGVDRQPAHDQRSQGHPA